MLSVAYLDVDYNKNGLNTNFPSKNKVALRSFGKSAIPNTKTLKPSLSEVDIVDRRKSMIVER